MRNYNAWIHKKIFGCRKIFLHLRRFNEVGDILPPGYIMNFFQIHDIIISAVKAGASSYARLLDFIVYSLYRS